MVAGAGGSLSLVCRVGSRLCALPVEHVIETMRPLPVEPMAGAPRFVRGLSVIRGVPTPVVDAARLLGVTEEESDLAAAPAAGGRFVTLRAGERPVALAVDAVLTVRALAEPSLHELPPLLRDAATDVVSAVSVLDAELLLVLRAARLVPGDLPPPLEARGREWMS